MADETDKKFTDNQVKSEKKLRIPSLDDLPPLDGEEPKKIPDPEPPPVAEEKVKDTAVSENHFIESEGLEEIRKHMSAESGHHETKPFEDFGKEDDGAELTPVPPQLYPIDVGSVVSSKEKPQTVETEPGDQNGKKEDVIVHSPQAARADLDVNFVSSDVVKIKMGDDVGLTNKDPTLKKIIIAAGWEVRTFEGDPPDLDLSCFILNKDRQTRKDPDFVFYNNRQSEEGEVVHKGDSRAGAGEGDDEMIEIDLISLPFDVSAIMVTLSIHDGEILDQDFSMIKDVFVRILNANTGQEMCKLVIPDDFLKEGGGAALKMGRIFRDGPKWRFHASTEIVKKGGLRALATEYGIIVM